MQTFVKILLVYSIHLHNKHVHLYKKNERKYRNANLKYQKNNSMQLTF